MLSQFAPSYLSVWPSNKNQSIWHFGGVMLPSKKYCLRANLLWTVGWSS
jgi:hypothetical protein